MKVTLDSRALADALARANAVAVRSGGDPVLSHAILTASGDGITLSATNRDVSLTETLGGEVKRPGVVALRGRVLLPILRPATGPVKISWMEGVDGAVSIKFQRTELKLLTVRVDGFPEMPAPSAPLNQVDPVVLRSVLARVQYSVGADDSRPVLATARLEVEDGVMTAVGTDGHRLALSRATIEGLPDTKPILIPRRGVESILRLLDGAETAAVSVDRPLLFVRSGRLMLAVKLADLTYPPFEGVIPKECSKVATLDRDEFVGVLRRGLVVAPNKTRTTKLTFSGLGLELEAGTVKDGSCADAIDCDYDGHPITFGANASYLIEAVEVIGTDRVRVEFNGELEPAAIRPVRVRDVEDGCSDLGVVMPVRLD